MRSQEGRGIQPITITKWRLARIGPELHLIGEVQNHPRFSDYTRIVTSPLAEIDPDRKWAVTKSGRHYRILEWRDFDTLEDARLAAAMSSQLGHGTNFQIIE